jgi:hypothetical protein
MTNNNNEPVFKATLILTSVEGNPEGADIQITFDPELPGNVKVTDVPTCYRMMSTIFHNFIRPQLDNEKVDDGYTVAAPSTSIN